MRLAAETSLRMPTARGQGRGGFTLVELITVIIVVAIVAAVSVPSLASLGSTRVRVATRQVFKDLTFARERAIATGMRTYVVFAPASERYTVLADDPANPGRANALILADPHTRDQYIRVLGTGDSVGVDIVSAVFDGGAEVGFDWNGRPLNSVQAPLAATGVVTLNGGNLVQVQANGGVVTCTTP
jgi:prepilin-type N-terminal cleavage/methylation domain-containing protein